MAKMNATEADSRSSAALNEANELFKNGSEPLPELNITAYEGTTSSITVVRENTGVLHLDYTTEKVYE